MNRQLIEETYEMRKLNISEKIKSFDCGDTDLNDFILNESFLKKIKYESFLYREALLAVSNVLENKTGCRFLTVDVYAAAVSFYDKNGFIPLNNEDVDSATRLLYFDLNDIMK